MEFSNTKSTLYAIPVCKKSLSPVLQALLALVMPIAAMPQTSTVSCSTFVTPPLFQEHLDRRIAERAVLDLGCAVRQAALQGLDEAKDGLAKVWGRCRRGTCCARGGGEGVIRCGQREDGERRGERMKESKSTTFPPGLPHWCTL